MQKLDPAIFRTVLEHTPLVSIDLLLIRPNGDLLVGWRENRPAQHWWFVPGGRIAKEETRAEAFARITAAEVGVPLDFKRARLAGAYDHLYDDNVFGDPGFGTHYVVLAYRFPVSADFQPRADAQHERFRWITLKELEQDSDIHDNTRAYRPVMQQN